MEIHELVVGPLKTNCYIVTSDMNHAVIIDPGFDAEKIAAKVKELGAKPKFILLTHGHFDHVGAAKAVIEYTGAKLYASKEDLDAIEDYILDEEDEDYDDDYEDDFDDYEDDEYDEEYDEDDYDDENE